jgi:hypothetical protein
VISGFVKFQDAVEQIAKGAHQFHAAGHTLKVYLSNTAPNVATMANKADLAEIAAGNGYPAGGTDVQNDVTEVAGVMSCTGVDVVWTASGAGFGPFRYVVLYNDTHASDALIGYWDYGAAITLTAPEPFTTDFGSSLFTLQ